MTAAPCPTPDERVARFDEYRATLDDLDRVRLDVLVDEVCNVFRGPSRNFSPRMAKELLMALLEFTAAREVR